MTQLKRYHVIKNAIEGICTIAEASVYLNLSSHRIKQLKKKAKLSGALAFIHGNKGRKPSNALSETKKEEIIALKKSYTYEKANFSHFRDLLLEKGISISYSTLYKILSESGLKSHRGQHNPAKHRMRKRKKAAGMMLQTDGTPYKIRLVTEFRINHIGDMQSANAFFPKFIKRYNEQFAVKPADSRSASVPMLKTVNLDTLLAVKVTRRTDNAGVFSVSNFKFEIKDKNVPPRAKIQLLISHKFGLKALYNGNTYRVFPCSYVDGPIKSGAFTAKATQEIIFKYFYKNAKAS